MSTQQEWKRRALAAEKQLQRLQQQPPKLVGLNELALEQLNRNWQLKFDMITQMFHAVVDQVKDNERHGRVIIESLRMSMSDFQQAKDMRESAAALRAVKADTDMLIKWYDAIGYIGISEWMRDWNADLEAIDHNSPEAGEQMDKIIADHGFEFKKREMGITWREMLNMKNGR